MTPQLIHVTKGRARGPKRRLPTTADPTGPAAAIPHPEPATEALIGQSLKENGPNDQSRR